MYFVATGYLYDSPYFFVVTGHLYDSPYELWQTTSVARRPWGWSPSACCAPGRQRSGTLSWVLRGELGLYDLLGPVIMLSIRPPRKEKKVLNQSLKIHPSKLYSQTGDWWLGPLPFVRNEKWADHEFGFWNSDRAIRFCFRNSHGKSDEHLLTCQQHDWAGPVQASFCYPRIVVEWVVLDYLKVGLSWFNPLFGSQIVSSQLNQILFFKIWNEQPTQPDFPSRKKIDLNLSQNVDMARLAPAKHPENTEFARKLGWARAEPALLNPVLWLNLEKSKNYMFSTKIGMSSGWFQVARGLVYLRAFICVYEIVCVCECVYIYIYIYIHIYIYIDIYVYIYICKHIYVFIHICIYIYRQILHIERKKKRERPP